MTVDVPYVVRNDSYEEEFLSSDDLFETVVSSLITVPDDALPVSVKILNIDEFSVEFIERDINGFYFMSDNFHSQLGRKFKKYMKGWFNE